ncbi:hypothetical protein KAW08_03210 [bacterium]|nr:hypothetical protein [bacterium]
MKASNTKEEDINSKSQIFHDRAWQIANEVNRLLISLATGALAGFFLLLSSNLELNLTLYQTIAIVLSILLMGLTVLFGLIALESDSKRNYFLAEINSQNNSDEDIAKHKEKKDKMTERKRWARNAINISFITGIVSASIYILLRIFNI